MSRWWVIVLVLWGCSGGTSPTPRAHETESESETEHETESEHETETAPPTSTAVPAPSGTTLHFLWPAPAEAEVHVVSEHDFGDGALVSAAYDYHLAVRRDGDRYVLTRTAITLVAHEGQERLRLGNVLTQDVTQHSGELGIDVDGTHIAPIGGFDPIEAAAHTVLAQAGIENPLADAVIALDQSGWQPINVVDYDTMIHEWNGRTFVLGVIQPAEATPEATATRILSLANAPCETTSDPDATGSCVEVVRTEQAERGTDRIIHVYTLLTEPDTLRPHRFMHESHTDSESAHVHYADAWTTTFSWR